MRQLSALTGSVLDNSQVVADIQKVPDKRTSSCKHAFLKSQARMTLQLALCLLLLMTLQLHRLLPPLPPPVINYSCLFIQCQLLYASYCTIQMYYSKYCTVTLKIFLVCVCLFFLYYLHEK